MADTSVLSVCVSNTGKSVMAAGLMRYLAAPNIHITSAGTHAKTAVNALSAQVLAEPSPATGAYWRAPTSTRSPTADLSNDGTSTNPHTAASTASPA
jgi:Protein-tyrosine-phosphatase